MAAATSMEKVHLSWTPLPLPVEAYKIYREDKAVGTTTSNIYDDQVELKSGEPLCYHVAGVGKDKQESELSRKVCTLIFAGELNEENRQDQLKFTLPGDSEVQFVTRVDRNLSVGTWLGRIVLLDSDGITAITHWAGVDGWKFPEKSFGPIALRAGQYFLALERQSGKGAYSQTISFIVQPLKNDAEPNNSYIQAVQVPLNQFFTGHLGYRGGGAQLDQQDWWKFTLPAIRDVSIIMTVDASLQIGGFFQMTNRLLQSDGQTEIASWTGPDGTTTQSIQVGPFRLMPGTYYLRVFRKEGYGGYKAKIKVTYPQ